MPDEVKTPPAVPETPPLSEPEKPADENKNPSAMEPLPVSTPDTSIPIETVVAQVTTENILVDPAPQPPAGRGRHPKGCKCGRCKQSGGTGGYEKGGTKPRIPADNIKPDFSDVTGEPVNGAKQPDFSDVLGQTAQATGTDYGVLASLFFDTGTGVATTIFGPEWQPRNPEEKAMVTGPLAVYLKSRGMTDLPPGVVLSIVCLAYSAPRLQAPSTKQKLGLWWMWVKSKIFRKKGII